LQSNYESQAAKQPSSQAAKQRQRAKSEIKAVPGKMAFLLEEINALEKQLKPAKGTNHKERKAESLLSTEIDLTNSSNEDEEYFTLPSTISNTSNELVKTSHPSSELVLNLNVNHEKHVLRGLASTGASRSIIPEGYTSKKTTWSTMGGQFTTDKTGQVTFSLPEFNLKK
jgi:hypothetical protein